jgi:chorismate mutase/prephenate dehydratase
MVSKRDDHKGAAIGSARAAAVHNLDILVPNIMDNANNKTRFISISAQPRYDENVETTAISFSTAHAAGALCTVLETFMVAGINLSRIESRPVSGEKYRFFADLQGNVLQEHVHHALEIAASHCDYFEVLGCYRDIL